MIDLVLNMDRSQRAYSAAIACAGSRVTRPQLGCPAIRMA